MMILVIGGAASGKSAYAEALLCRLSADAPKFYVATMEPHGPEAAARIAKHRQARAGRGFVTLERFTSLSELRIPDGSAVLLEDLGNLCANEMYNPVGSGQGAEVEIIQAVRRLQKRCSHFVIVSNEVFADGADYQGGTRSYLRTLACLHRRIAGQADAVCEVLCGIPFYYKGAEPSASGKGAEEFANP